MVLTEALVETRLSHPTNNMAGPTWLNKKQASLLLFLLCLHAALVTGLLALVLAFYYADHQEAVVAKVCLAAASLDTILLVLVQCFHLCAGKGPIGPGYVTACVMFSMIATGGSFISADFEDIFGHAFRNSCVFSFLSYLASGVMVTIYQSVQPCPSATTTTEKGSSWVSKWHFSPRIYVPLQEDTDMVSSDPPHRAGADLMPGSGGQRGQADAVATVPIQTVSTPVQTQLVRTTVPTQPPAYSETAEEDLQMILVSGGEEEDRHQPDPPSYSASCLPCLEDAQAPHTGSPPPHYSALAS